MPSTLSSPSKPDVLFDSVCGKLPDALNRRDTLLALYESAKDYVKMANRVFRGWPQAVLETDRVEAENPVQSFYALLATRTGVSIGSMTPATAEVVADMLERTQTMEERRDFAAFLNAIIVDVRPRRRGKLYRIPPE